MTPDLPLTGGCLCGGVRYEITEPPVAALYCHCTRCQRRTGTASSVQIRVPRGSVRVVAGRELLRTFKPDDGRPKVFCSACGSAMFATRADDPDPLVVRMGTLDDDPGIRPQFRQYVASAAPWEPLPDDGLPRYDGPAP